MFTSPTSYQRGAQLGRAGGFVMIVRLRVRSVAAVLAAVALAAAGGCGAAEYRRMVNASVDHARTSAPYRTLYAYTSLEGTPCTIRVPLAFNHSYRVDSAHPQDGPKIRPDRFQPPFLEIEGLRLCYEGNADDAMGLKMPFYCYLAALQARPGDADRLQTDIQAKLKAKFEKTPDEWERADAYSEDGKAAPWKRIRVEGDQVFQVNTGQKVETQKLPGIFELWMRDLGNWIVMVGWRTPKSIEAPAPEATGGDFPIPTKPDLSTSPESMTFLTAGTLKLDETAPPAAEAGN